MKKIAVITPVFNGERFLSECLESVALSVTGGEFEIEHIVVDDCSTDKSWEFIQDSKSTIVRPFRLEKNMGPSAARNFGIKQTDADFIFCLDQDDVLFQNSLNALFEFSQAQKSDWVYGDFLRVHENLSYALGDDYYGHQFEDAGDLLTSIFIGEHFFQQNSLFRKNIFDEAGGFGEQFQPYHDLDLAVRFALAGLNPKYLAVPLYLHRFHGDNLSKVMNRENNKNAHKNDLKTLHSQYKTALESSLDSQQLTKIQNFLTEP